MVVRLGVALLAAIVAGGCSGSEPSPTPTSTATPLAAVSTASPSATTPATPATSPTPAPARPSGSSGTCPAGSDGLRASAIALDRTLHVDGTRFALTTAGIHNRSGDAYVDDLMPTWATLTSETPTVAAPPGSTGRLGGSLGLSLVGGTLAVFPASAFDLAANRFPDPGSVTPTPLTASNGSLTFAFPRKVGRWVLAFGVRWQTACLAGDGVAYVFAATR